MSSLHAVIMAGGSGTRFWPASRSARPKQFLPLVNGKPLIEATLDRLRGLCADDNVWVATNKKQAKALTRLLPNLPRDRLIIEPEPRDTAPCVALATATIAAVDPTATMIVLPADHAIEPLDAFHSMLRAGVELASDQKTLVTFGIRPTYPATGYGYLQCGSALAGTKLPAFVATKFCEKPNLETAKQFVAQGNFLWNSGIFVWRVEAIRRAMAATEPALATSTTAMLAAIQKQERAACTRAFLQAPPRSIDYAVMEKADTVAVIEAPIRWDDVGSFPALAAIAAPDGEGNIVVANHGGSHLALRSRGNIVYVDGARTVALFGVSDLVVVAVDDAVLVCTKDQAHDLKALVEHVRAAGRTDLL